MMFTETRVRALGLKVAICSCGFETVPIAPSDG